jgi:uncharacterized protein (TIGR03067 family)
MKWTCEIDRTRRNWEDRNWEETGTYLNCASLRLCERQFAMMLETCHPRSRAMNYRHTFASFVFMGMSAFCTTLPTAAQSLDGVWEITAVIDDGRVVSPADVRTNYAADGRVTINGQVAQLILPMTYQRKQLPFAVDVGRSPARLDFAGAEKTGGRGIILPSKDSLILCLASRDRDRPASFSSQPGSGNLLVTLNRASADAGSTPTPGQPPTYDDEQLRRLLVGTWGHQDEHTIHYLTLNQDGSMSATMTWKDNFKKMFHQDVRSSGTWRVQDGVVMVKIDTSSDKERRGQLFSFRIRSINSTELVAVDGHGTVRQEWKAQ